jgi:MOSC domain-containing protein YiiM
MFQGSVLSINIAAESREPMRSVDEARAVAGKGLEGDRYFDQPEALVTLIAAEAIEALERDTGLKLEHKDARRNIVTRDVPLNDLVEQEFNVGDVRLRGVRLSETCQHLASLTDQRVLKGLVHRAGLKAQPA